MLINNSEFDSVIPSVKGKVALPGLVQIRLKQACEFFQFALEIERTNTDQYLTHNSIKGHAVQFKTLKEMKDNKEMMALTKLTVSTNILA